jgi:hypothetical protein
MADGNDEDILRYDIMVERALRAVVRDALNVATESGLPGEHHFYITFRTDHPGVELSDALRSRYPEEMTIVIQHQFWDLAVAEDYFAVTLSFSSRPERLVVPFEAVSAFADPAVRFGLQFEALFGGGEEEESAEVRSDNDTAGPPAEDAGKEPPKPQDRSADKKADKEGDNVVTLDSFRKNK